MALNVTRTGTPRAATAGGALARSDGTAGGPLAWAAVLEATGNPVGVRVSGDPFVESAEPRSARPAEFAPTPQELRISIRLLLHIARQGRYGPFEVPPESLTQAGMARAIGASQGAVSNALSRLVQGGALEVERSHVRRKMVRLKVYRLTVRGEALVRALRQRFGPRV